MSPPKDVRQDHCEEIPEEVAVKAKQLAELIRNSKHCVVLSGAGISTAAGFPDGLSSWDNRIAAMRRRLGNDGGLEEALPTVTHMAIRSLVDQGLVKHVISQNADGLHRKSGIAHCLTELYGNANVEVCVLCGREYLRDYSVRRASGNFDHDTGRRCAVPGCNAPLHDSIVNIGEALSHGPLEAVTRELNQSDLLIVLGSSLTVAPAADLPRHTVWNGGRFVIVNLRPTHLDALATLKIHSRCDFLMTQVMQHLGAPIPPFLLHRSVALWRLSDTECCVAGQEPDGIPATLFRSVRASGRTLAQEPFTAGCPLDQPWTARLTFFGHCKEPDLDLTLPAHRQRVDYDLTFDPSRGGQWSVRETDPPRMRPPNQTLVRRRTSGADRRTSTEPEALPPRTPRRAISVRALWNRSRPHRNSSPSTPTGLLGLNRSEIGA